MAARYSTGRYSNVLQSALFRFHILDQFCLSEERGRGPHAQKLFLYKQILQSTISPPNFNRLYKAKPLFYVSEGLVGKKIIEVSK
jgi:hypothetical protein